jgi:hypothetical protein
MHPLRNPGSCYLSPRVFLLRFIHLRHHPLTKRSESKTVRKENLMKVSPPLTRVLANTTPVVLAVFDTTPPVATENETKNHTASLTEPTPAYLLAAEADPVPSNLDKLPPNSRKILKRKSEPVSQEGERKRGRYGGIVGRPRKSEQRESRKAVQGDRLPQGNADNEVDSSPQMVTRRSARRSAAANLDTSKSTEPTSELAKQSPRLSENQAIAENPPNDENTADMEDVTMSGMEKDKTTSKDTSTPTRSSRKKKSRSSADSQLSSAVSTSKLPTNAPGKQLLKVGLGRSSSKTSGAQSDSHPTPCQPTTSSTASMEQNNTFHDHVANGPSKFNNYLAEMGISAVCNPINLNRPIHLRSSSQSSNAQRGKPNTPSRSRGAVRSSDHRQRHHGDSHSCGPN